MWLLKKTSKQLGFKQQQPRIPSEVLKEAICNIGF